MRWHASGCVRDGPHLNQQLELLERARHQRLRLQRKASLLAQHPCQVPGVFPRATSFRALPECIPKAKMGSLHVLRPQHGTNLPSGVTLSSVRGTITRGCNLPAGRAELP